NQKDSRHDMQLSCQHLSPRLGAARLVALKPRNPRPRMTPARPIRTLDKLSPRRTRRPAPRPPVQSEHHDLGLPQQGTCCDSRRIALWTLTSILPPSRPRIQRADKGLVTPILQKVPILPEPSSLHLANGIHGFDHCDLDPASMNTSICCPT